jgi:hypothetical protein
MSREVNRAARRREARKGKNRKSGMVALSIMATTSLMSSYVNLIRTEPSFAVADYSNCNGSTDEIEVNVSGSRSEDVARINLLDEEISASTARCVNVTFNTSDGGGDELHFSYWNGTSQDYADLDLITSANDKKVFFIGNDVIFNFNTVDNFDYDGSFEDSPIFTEIDLEVHDITFKYSQLEPTEEDGHGGVIRAESDLSIFGSSFWYNNITTSEGFTSFGAAVWIEGIESDLYIEDTQFVYNLAFTFYGASSGEGGGGAINGQNAKSVTVKDSAFRFNGTTGYGGAIKAGDDLFIEGTEFVENFTYSTDFYDYTRGGAIFADDDATISSSVFRENGSVSNYGYGPGGDIDMTDFGGAVYVDNGATITGSIFELNSANVSGGAVWAYSELSISDTEFADNTSNFEGGAIFLDYSSYYGVTASVIRGSSFTDNRSGQDGGAVYVRNYSYDDSDADFVITISDSTFTDNFAQSEGGALAVDNYAYITNSTFNGNRSREDGGAIHLQNNSVVSNSTFVDNMARFSGGAILGYYENEIVFNTFKDNVSDSDNRFSDSKIAQGEALSIAEGDIVGNIFAGDSEFPQLDFGSDRPHSMLYNLSTGDDFLAIESESTNRGNVALASFALDSELRDNDTTNFSQTLSLGSSSSAAYGFVQFSTVEGWAPLTDQRGVSRTSSANINAGAFEGFISRSAPSGSGGGSSPSGGGSSPAAFSALIISSAAPKAGAVVKVSGPELKKITEVYVGQTKVKISRVSDSELSFKLPKSVAGSVTLRLVGAGIDHIHILNIDGSVRNETVVPGFASNSTKLTRTMKKEIKAFVESNAGLTSVTCKGFTSAPATREDLRLARERGQATCDYIKKLNPELTVKVLAGAHTNKPGKQVRRVRLEMN